jgi:hypothetical protein
MSQDHHPTQPVLTFSVRRGDGTYITTTSRAEAEAVAKLDKVEAELARTKAEFKATCEHLSAVRAAAGISAFAAPETYAERIWAKTEDHKSALAAAETERDEARAELAKALARCARLESDQERRLVDAFRAALKGGT